MKFKSKLVEKYMREGHNQYAHMQGMMVLREWIAEKETLESAAEKLCRI
jgi:hypothetical protein